MSDYICINDEDLVEIIQKSKNGNKIDQGAFEELVRRYRKFINYKVYFYFIKGADREDIFQEGLLGLYNAVETFRPEKNTSFASYSSLCIVRRIQSAVRKADAKKHAPLNQYMLYTEEYTEMDECRMPDRKIVLENKDSAYMPEKALLFNELRDTVIYVLENLLSEKERRLFLAFVNGSTYCQISEQYNIDHKEIDNAIQRARRKLHSYTKS